MKKPTLTIGIPIYNEEDTIINLLTSIEKQKKNNFTLDKVILTSDGSTDKSIEKIKKYIKNKKLFRLIASKKRIGKAQRLNELYKINKSDLLLTLDADVFFGSQTEIEKFVKKIKKNTVVVAGNLIPFKINKTFIEKSLYTIYTLWDDIRKQITSGDSIYNLFGAATLLKKEFAKKIVYPVNITCDEAYLYCKAKEVNGFSFAQNTIIYHYPVKTISDYRKFASRSLNERCSLELYFGKKSLNYYKLSRGYKIKSVFSFLKTQPIQTTSALLIILFVKLNPYMDSLNANGLWEQVISTKIG